MQSGFQHHLLGKYPWLLDSYPAALILYKWLSDLTLLLACQGPVWPVMGWVNLIFSWDKGIGKQIKVINYRHICWKETSRTVKKYREVAKSPWNLFLWLGQCFITFERVTNIFFFFYQHFKVGDFTLKSGSLASLVKSEGMIWQKLTLAEQYSEHIAFTMAASCP